MEFIFALIFVWGFFWLIGVIFDTGQKKFTEHRVGSRADSISSSNVSKKVTSDPMEFRTAISIENEEISGTKMKILQIKAIGRINPYNHDTNVKMVASIFDITSTKPESALYMWELYQFPDTLLLEAKSTDIPAPPLGYYDEWVTVIKIPYDSIVFPHKGKRKIQIATFIEESNNPLVFQFPGVLSGSSDAQREKIFGFSILKKSLNIKTTGYLDEAKDKKRVQELIIQLGMYISATDGNMDKKEGQIIQSWVSRILTIPGMTEDDKENFNTIIKTSYDNAKNKKLDLNKILNELKKIAIKAERYDAIELALDIMTADGKADKKEEEAINEIAKKLNLSKAEFRALKEKKLASIDQNLHKRDKYEAVGIDKKWSKEKQEEHLTNEFGKWNALINHKDKKLAIKAKRMLELISEIKKEL